MDPKSENSAGSDCEALLDILSCPDCKADLSFSKNESMYKCLDCGTVFPIHDNVVCLLPSTLDRRKLNEDKMYKYWANNQEIYEDWVVSIKRHADFSFFKTDFLPRHGQTVSGRMMEIGAGLCWASAIIKSMFPSVQVVASDVSSTALLRGRYVCAMLDSNVDHFVACDVESLPFKDKTFTAVFGASIIHHLPNPRQGLVEVHRVLKKGGICLGLDFGMGRAAADRIRKTLLKSRFYPTGAAERTFGIVESVLTFDEWEDMFRSAGFRNVKVTVERGYSSPPFRHDHWVYRLIPFYYKILSHLPDNFVKLFLGSGISITGRK